MLKNINWFDVAFIVIIIGSAILGFVAGFTDKFLSLLSWVAAGLLTFHIYPFLRPWVGSFISNDLGASITTAAAIFIVLLVSFKLGTSFLSKSVKNSPLGSLDRGLGVILGAITGFLLLAIVNLGLQSFITSSSYPDSLKTSKVWPFVVIGSTYVEKMIPLKLSKASSASSIKMISKDELVAKFSRAPSSQPSTVGYTRKDRDRMNSLLKKN